MSYYYIIFEVVVQTIIQTITIEVFLDKSIYTADSHSNSSWNTLHNKLRVLCLKCYINYNIYSYSNSLIYFSYTRLTFSGTLRGSLSERLQTPHYVIFNHCQALRFYRATSLSLLQLPSNVTSSWIADFISIWPYVCCSCYRFNLFSKVLDEFLLLHCIKRIASIIQQYGPVRKYFFFIRLE